MDTSFNGPHVAYLIQQIVHGEASEGFSEFAMVAAGVDESVGPLAGSAIQIRATTGPALIELIAGLLTAIDVEINLLAEESGCSKDFLYEQIEKTCEHNKSNHRMVVFDNPKPSTEEPP